MLDAKARLGDGALRRRHGRHCLLVGIEHEAVAAIADRVRLHLDAALQRRRRDAQDHARLVAQQADALRRIAVRREQRRAARTERAVHVELDAADHEAVIAARPRTAGQQMIGVCARAVDRGVDTQADLLLRIELAQRCDFRLRGSCILELRPAHAHAAVRTRLECQPRCPRPSAVARGLSMRGLALSTSMPVGSPVTESFRISPPGGFGVSRVMPAFFSARLLTTIACPSMRSSTTGRSLTTASRSARVGNAAGVQRDSIQPRPWIHAPLSVAARSRRRCCRAARLSTPVRSK